jgi:hypothetical protein
VSTAKCARCKQAAYCGVDHQKTHWKAHKQTCVPIKNNSGWARGLSIPDSYEWLANCYQLRCDDDYAYGSCYLHGPYDPDATAPSIADDFYTFCMLAKRRKVVPADWNWPAFLLKAAEHVGYAFEKSDAQERWGSENVFAAFTGGRSLRHMGEIVYGASAHDNEADLLAANVSAATADHFLPRRRALRDEVGGRDAWLAFLGRLHAKRSGSDAPVSELLKLLFEDCIDADTMRQAMCSSRSDEDSDSDDYGGSDIDDYEFY